MKTIYEIFKKRCPKLKSGLGEFGIEIETETKGPESYPEKFFLPEELYQHPGGYPKKFWQLAEAPEWKAVEDGSLRNFGREFVLKQPLNFDIAIGALHSFGEATKKVKFIKNAPATSVHVHMNITEFTPLQLVNLITTLVLTENLLTEFSGPNRRSNTFARPVRCAEEFLNMIQGMVNLFLQGSTGALMFSEQHVKYGTINLAPLSTYGSVEIRCFRGTTDIEEIQDWLCILNRVYKFAKTPGLTPSSLYKTYQESEFEIVDLIFGGHAHLLKTSNYISLLRRNEWYLASIAVMCENWYALDDKYTKEKVEKLSGLGDWSTQSATYASIFGEQPIITITDDITSTITSTLPDDGLHDVEDDEDYGDDYEESEF